MNKTVLPTAGEARIKLMMLSGSLLRPIFGLLVAVLAPAALGAAVKYRGFTIDLSPVAKSAEAAETQHAIEEQIDIVHAVGVPAAMIAFFQGVPLEVVPAETMPKISPGLYGPNRKTVKVTSRIIRIGRRPVLLHELLHAYHHQQMPGGYQNGEIISLYEAARKLNAFTAKSHMMQNEREFFACAGTTFLFGVTGQEPFVRDKVGQQQAELQRFLEKIFGPGAGHYAGSLPRSGTNDPEPN